MADRRCGDAVRQQPFASAQERVYDGGGGGGPGPAFGSDFDHGSYMTLLGAGVNPQPTPTPWAVEEVTAAPAINLTPQFSMANYAPSSYDYQQHASFVSPLAANLHPYPSYLRADPPPQWPPRATPASSLSPPSFAFLPTAPRDQHVQVQLLRAAAVLGGGVGSQQAAPPGIEQPAKDGYNWRKYGQKQLKDAESPRSYYKCTRDGCSVKKIIERSFDGCIKEITYKGRHSHPRPPKPRRGHAGAMCAGDDVSGAGGAGAEKDEDEPSDEDMFNEDDGEDGPDRDACDATGQRVVKRPKIILQTLSEVDLLDDGYRWRKYGQKVVKGNHHPRSYYKCTAANCNVRKQIERASADPKCVLTTYTGRHSHDPPGRGAGAAAAAGCTSGNLVPSTMNSAGGTCQQSSSGARQLMKEESQE